MLRALMILDHDVLLSAAGQVQNTPAQPELSICCWVAPSPAAQKALAHDLKL